MGPSESVQTMRSQLVWRSAVCQLLLYLSTPCAVYDLHRHCQHLLAQYINTFYSFSNGIGGHERMQWCPACSVLIMLWGSLPEVPTESREEKWANEIWPYCILCDYYVQHVIYYVIYVSMSYNDCILDMLCVCMCVFIFVSPNLIFANSAGSCLGSAQHPSARGSVPVQERFFQTVHTSSSNGVHAVEFVFGLGLGLVEHADFLGYCKMICTELLWSMSKFKIFPHRDITCWDSRVEEGASPHLLPRNWQTYSHLPGLTRQGSMATPVAACSSKFVGGVSNRHSRHSVHWGICSSRGEIG